MNKQPLSIDSEEKSELIKLLQSLNQLQKKKILFAIGEMKKEQNPPSMTYS
jgi:hypothetical protein